MEKLFAPQLFSLLRKTSTIAGDVQKYLEEEPLSIEEKTTISALHFAVREEKWNLFDVLYKYCISKEISVDRDVIDEEGNTILFFAVRNGLFITAQHLLSNYPLDLKIRFTREPYLGYNIMHFLCCSQLLNFTRNDKFAPKFLKFLLQKGMDANARINDEQNETVLHCCAKSNSSEMMEILIDAGANVNCTNKHGITPLMMCCSGGYTSALFTLLEKARDDLKLDIKDSVFGDSAIHYAFQCQMQRLFPDGYEITFNQQKCAYILARAGADLDSKATKDKLLALNYCSDSLATILRFVNKYPTLFSESLEMFLLLPDQLFLTNPNLSPEERKQIYEAVVEFKNEREEEEALNSKRSACPMSQGNRALLKKKNKNSKLPELPKNHGSIVGADIAQCPFASKLDSAEKEKLMQQHQLIKEEKKGLGDVTSNNQPLNFIMSRRFWITVQLFVLFAMIAVKLSKSKVDVLQV